MFTNCIPKYLFYFINAVFSSIRNLNKYTVCLLVTAISTIFFSDSLYLSLHLFHFILMISTLCVPDHDLCSVSWTCAASCFTSISVARYFSFTSFLSLFSLLFILFVTLSCLSCIFAFLHCGFFCKEIFF